MSSPPRQENSSSNDVREAVYAHLRAIAQHKLSHERQGHTLQATALVHEAFLRLQRAGSSIDQNSEQFLWAAAEAMRRILIEHARARNATKRGGGVRRLDWSEGFADVADLASDEHADKIEALDAAILRLEVEDERAARVVRLRFFVGLSNEEVATTLNVSERTTKRDWEFARTWLLRALTADSQRD